MLAEAKTGYVCNFEVYLGKCAPSEHTEKTLGTRVVLDISKPFHHTHRHLYFNNFFNSEEVIEELLKVCTFACGTLQTNKYPPQVEAWGNLPTTEGEPIGDCLV